MKYLTKSLLLLISLGTILFFAFSAEKVAAQTLQEITACTEACMGNNILKNIDITTRKCEKYNPDDPYLPYGTIPCDNAYINCYSYCKNKLSSSATPTLAPTRTPTPTSSRKELGESCSSNRQCSSNFCDPTDFICVQRIPTPTPIPAPKLTWQQIAVCPASTPTPIPTQTPSTTAFQTNCPTNDIGRCGGDTRPFPNCTGLLYSAGTRLSNCTKELPNCWSCPQPTPTPVPSSANLGTEANPFKCVDQTGSFSGNYQCAGVTNGSPQCPDTFSPFNFSPTFITSCGQNQVCCKQNPVMTPTPTGTPTPTPPPTPSPTPLPGSVHLALALAQQGLTSAPVNRSRSVTVVLKGADDKLITKTGTADYSNGTFNGTINLGVLPAGSYKLKVKVGNFLKSLISDVVISGAASSAQTTIVAGLSDEYNDNINAISFYANGLRTCFGSTLGLKKCDNPQDVDLNGDANVDVIDYQIYLKGIRSLKEGLPI